MKDASDPLWPARWIRPALRTAVLACLEEGPLHGYGLAGALAERGFGRPKGGSLYPLLEDLHREALITDTWEPGDSGPGRRIYQLLPAGQRALREERVAWQSLAMALGPLTPPTHTAHTGSTEASS